MRKTFCAIFILILLLTGCSKEKAGRDNIFDPSSKLYQGPILLVSIPAGTFQMGDIQGGGGSYDRPVHTVTLSSFEMSIYEVTQEQYRSFIGSNPSSFSHINDRPVEGVSWYDAAKFCNKLSVHMGYEKCYRETGDWECDYSKNGFRLPTEAEWEDACRAGTKSR